MTFLFLLVFFLDAVFSWYCSSSLKPLCFRADSYTCFVSRKEVFLLLVLASARLLSRFKSMSGMLLIMLFGWLDDIVLTYRGVSFGFF